MLEKFCILCNSSIKKFHFNKDIREIPLINKPVVFEDKTSTNSEVELITHISMNYKPNVTETCQFDNFSCPHFNLTVFNLQEEPLSRRFCSNLDALIVFEPASPGLSSLMFLSLEEEEV